MATTAATLQVAIEALTADAMGDLRRFNTQLQKTDRTTATATTRTSALGSATRSAGTRLRSAAGYAASAAAAYLSISQAKAAVTTTQDLAKTTAGLNRNLGFTVKEGSRWAAVAKSRDIDAKALTMSFTTLSRRVVEAAHAVREGGGAAETAMVPFTRLGLSQEQIVKGSKDLNSFMPKLADAFGDAAGGAKRQASAQQLLGRGYATVLPLFASGAEGLKEQQMWADKYGTTLNEKTLKAQMDLVQAQRESKVAWLGIQMTFAQFLTPALQKANAEFQKIAAIMGDKRLTDAEKFRQVAGIIEKWAGKALDAFVAILPKLAEKAAESAPRIAAALVEGFMNAPVWGTLLGTGWLLSKFGGLGAFGGLGTKMGTRFGMGFGGAAGPIAVGLIGSALAGAKFAPKVADALQGDIGVSERLRMTAEHWDITIHKAKRLTEFMERHPGVGVPEALEAIRPAINSSVQRWEHFWGQMRRATDEGGHKVKTTAKTWLDAFGTETGRIFRRTGEDAKQSSKKVAEHWEWGFGKVTNTAQTKGGQFRNNVAQSFWGGANASADAMGHMATETNKTLKSLGGAKGKDVYVAKFGKMAETSGGGAGAARQKGGIMVPGVGSGDKVRALLEPGEVVINREAVRAMGGAQKVNRVNDIVPRFAKGGVAKGNTGMAAMIAEANKFEARSFPYVWGGGHSGFGIQPVDCSGAVSDVLHAAGLLSAPMVSGALMGWGKPASGSEPLVVYANPHHTVMSLNGKTFGTSGTNPGGGAGWIEGASGRSLAPGAMRTMDVAGAAGAAFGAERIARALIDGPAGAIQDMAQRSADLVHAAANKKIAASVPAGAFGGGDAEFGAYKGPLDKVFPHPTTLANPGIALSAKQVAGLASKAGLSPVSTAVRVAKAESAGFHPGIVGYDPGGTRGLGLWQITTGFNDDVIRSLGGETQMFNPWRNAQAAKMILDRQGWNAWVAFQEGGIVGMQGGGQVPYSPFVPTPEQAEQVAAAWAAVEQLAPAQGIGVPAPNVKDLKGLVGKLYKSDKAEDRRQMTRKFSDQVKAAGITVGAEREIADLQSAVTNYGLNADAASQITAATGDGTVPQKVRGFTETAWTWNQLRALFDLRTKLIDAQSVVEKRREQLQDLLAAAQKHLDDVKKAIKKAESEAKKLRARIKDAKTDYETNRGKWRERLDAELEKPKKKRDNRLIADLREKLAAPLKLGAMQRQLEKLNNQNDKREYVQKGLEQIIPGITDRRETLATQKDDLLTQLDQVQGSSTMRPGGIKDFAFGELLGDIFTAQMKLRELSATATPDQPEPRSITDLLNFVQAARLGVFGPAIPAFAAGGIAPGGMALVGEKGPELATLPAGTRVHSNAESQGMMGGDQYFDIYIGGEKIAEHVRAQLRSSESADLSRWRAGVISR